MPEPAVPSPSPAGGSDPLLGTAIGPFTLLRRIGEGGMGAVYLARQDKPAREVALKILRTGLHGDRLLRRFELEAEMLGRLHHPGIAQIHHAGTFPSGQGSLPYFAMEYVEGKPIDVHARVLGLPLAQRLELLARVCDAVQHAHQKGLVHRDLKPGNILVTADGQPKVLDFGVARAVETGAGKTMLTELGDLVGTLGYMSPEQVSGDPADLDTRADVYALGVVLFELLTGQLPFPIERRLLHEAVRMIREDEPRRLSTIDRIYRGDVETIVAKALERDKARRYQSASALAADLRRFLADQPIAARPPSAAYQLVKFARRHRYAFASLVAVALALLAGTAVAVWQASRATAAEQLAVAQAQLAGRRETEARTQAARAEQAAAFAQSILGGLSPYVANGQDTRLLKTVLQQAESRLPTELRGLPEVEGAIRTTLTSAYTSLGLYAEAGAQADRATALLEPLGPDRPEMRDLQQARATLQLRRGDTAAAVATLRDLAARQRRLLGDTARKTLEVRNALADALMRNAEYEAARAEARAASAAALAQFGSAAALTLDAQATHATLEYYFGNVGDAVRMMRQVADARRREAGADALQTWEDVAQLAMMLSADGAATEAEGIYREALGQFGRLLGTDHPQTLNVRNNLGVCLRGLQRLPEAETLFRAVAEVRTRVLGPDHPDTLFAFANVADVLLDQGKLDDAEPIARTVLDGRRKKHGPDHPRTLESLHTLAGIRRARGDKAGGAALLGEVAAATRRHPATPDGLVIALYNHAAALQDADDHDRAEPVFREALAEHQKTGDRDQPWIAALHNGLAKCLEHRGDRAGADAEFTAALAMRRRLFGDGHPEIDLSLQDQARALLDRGDFAAAERTCTAAVRNAEQASPPVEATVAVARGLLGAALRGLDRLDEAEPLLRAAEQSLAASGRHAATLRYLRLVLAELCDRRETVQPGKGHAAEAAAFRDQAGPKDR